MRSPLDPAALLLVFLGGAAGTASRYGLDEALATTAWPASTFIVNVVGSGALGAVVGRWQSSTHRLRLLLGTGFMGAFTTYSALAAQSLGWPSDNQVGAVIYLSGSAGVGLSAAVVGLAFGSRWRSA